VRTDGQPVRVPIGAMELPAAHRIVAAPETSLNAARTVALTNTGARPLLPGAVALYREGAFLGLTDLDFVAEGESFALHFGVADQLKLSRVLDRRQSSLARGQRTRMQVAFDVGVENLSKEPVALKLMDRVPVSEDREIRVFGVSVEPDGRPDAQGLIAWDLELKPGEKRVYRVAYGVEYPAEALHRARDMQQDSVPNAAAPIVDQIRNLEAKF
jgi:uncharacterized protein (TIGR02231 family)